MGQGLFERARAFSAEECAGLARLMEAGGGEAAPVYHAAGAAVDPRMRRATTLLLVRGPETDWMFARLDELFAAAAALFGTPVDPVFEPVQLVRYGPGDHFQMWHSDAGVDRIEARRISASIELSEPGEYSGGRLEVAGGA